MSDPQTSDWCGSYVLSLEKTFVVNGKSVKNKCFIQQPMEKEVNMVKK